MKLVNGETPSRSRDWPSRQTVRVFPAADGGRVRGWLWGRTKQGLGMNESLEVRGNSFDMRSLGAWESVKTATPRAPGMLEISTQENIKNQKSYLENHQCPHWSLWSTKLAP